MKNERKLKLATGHGWKEAGRVSLRLPTLFPPLPTVPGELTAFELSVASKLSSVVREPSSPCQPHPTPSRRRPGPHSCVPARLLPLYGVKLLFFELSEFIQLLGALIRELLHLVLQHRVSVGLFLGDTGLICG